MKKFAIPLLLALSFSVAAQAYVPPSSFLIEQVARKRSKLRGLRVKTRISGPQTQIKEVLWLDRQSQEIKGRFFNANDEEIYAYSRRLHENESLGSTLLFETNRDRLIRALLAQGVPVIPEEALATYPTPEERRAAEKTGIGRLGSKVAWKIGTEPPSLWILKDEFTPLRLMYRPGGRDLEIRFEETTVTRDFPFSRSITVLRGGETLFTGDAMEVMVNPDLSDMKKIPVSGLPALPSQLDSATQSLIENWLQWIR